VCVCVCVCGLGVGGWGSEAAGVKCGCIKVECVKRL